MEAVLKSLKEEIRKAVSEEKINTGKLFEIIHIYRRVESYSATSVSQLPMTPYENEGFGYPLPVPPVRNETVSMYDGFIKTFQEIYKSQNPSHAESLIFRYIGWYKFLSENRPALLHNEILDNETIRKINELKTKLYEKILIEMEKELENKNKVDEVKTKLYEHIIDGVKEAVETKKI